MVPQSELIQDVLASDLVDDPNRSAAGEPLRADITARRRRRWGNHATLAAVVLGAAGTFLALSRTIKGENGNPFDRAVLRTVGHRRHPVISAVVRGISFFGSVPGAGAVALAAAMVARKKPRLAGQIAAGAVGGIAAELVFKRMFRRKRPQLLEHLETVSSTSFPSGHAMSSSALYLTLAFVGSRSRRFRGNRGRLLIAGGAVAATIGATRVYLGVHWPTDVLGGLALGTAWSCATEAAFNLTGAARVEREALAGTDATLAA